MSQPAVAALAPLPFELVYSDGEPLETRWHVLQMTLFFDVIGRVMAERGKSDFFVGGNMFVYYSRQQAEDVAKGRSYFRGPDVFWVDGVDARRKRQVWVAWEEEGRLPDVIVELLSPSTATIDRTVKKDLYAQAFRTAEYYLYDPETRELAGFRLAGRSYRSRRPDGQRRLWSEQLGAYLGLWHGIFRDQEDDWVRLFRSDGSLVPTADEQAEAERQRAEAERQRAEAERQRAEAERQRAEAEHQRAEAERLRAEAERLRAESAEAEVARLRVLLQEHGHLDQ